MATDYRVAIGLDQAEIDTDPIVPEPNSEGVEWTRETPAADRTLYREGPFIVLRFDMIGTIEIYLALLQQFGIATATTANVTLKIPESPTYAYDFVNAIAQQPMHGRDVRRSILLRDVRIYCEILGLSSPP
jgi:hypothetical protein